MLRTRCLAAAARNILFLGGDDVSLVVLRALTDRARAAGGSVTAVTPPTAAGHHPNPVDAFCREAGLPCTAVPHPKSLTKGGLLAPPAAAEPYDAAVVASFRYFLPDGFLSAMPRTVNMHPSLLPRYRGASPIFETLRRGDRVGGATVIKLTPGEWMDCGDVVAQAELPLPPAEDAREYFPRVTALGRDLVLDVLDDFDARWAAATPQHGKARLVDDPFHAPLLRKGFDHAQWPEASGAEVFNQWRAFVGKHPLRATLNRAVVPVAAQIKHKAKLVPQPITFTEAVPPPARGWVRTELDALPALPPGTLYWPKATLQDGTDVCCVRCREDWFAFTHVTWHNHKPQAAKTLAGTLLLRRGEPYPGAVGSP